MFLTKLYHKIVSIPVKLLVKSTTLPESPLNEFDIDLKSPIYYLLQRRSASSFLMLQNAMKAQGLPEPQLMSKSLLNNNQEKIPNGAVFFLQNKNVFWFSGNPIKKYQLLLNQLIEEQKQNVNIHHQIIPASVYWGRNPGKEKSLLKVFFTDTENTSAIRKLFLMLFVGRDSFVRISQPINLSTTLADQTPTCNFLRKLTRILRVHFHRNRRAMMGPLVSNRRQLMTGVEVSDHVNHVIKREVKAKKNNKKELKKLANKYVDEIAAAYSYKTVRIFGHILRPLWNKIYDGIEVKNVERIRQLATTHELIYVPSHRSHTDYLLLSYSLYHAGLVPPHIAAGINLNFWPAGPLFRRCGAFFLRRSFGGNKLYTSVFSEYIFELINRGIPIKFFPEGGRSRTGRLLNPKTGLLSMITQSALRGTRKPIALVPIYIGYERMFEGKSYLNELKGREKKKESFKEVLNLRKRLKQVFGKVYLNFSEPLILNEYFDKYQPDWKNCHGELNAKPAWLTSRVNHLSTQLMEKINAATTLNSVSLVGLVLLSCERYAIDKKSLSLQLQLLLNISQQAPYSEQTYTPNETPEQLLLQAEKLGTITISQDDMGEIISTDYKTAGLLTYYRNNILHTYILSSLIASNFLNRTSITQAALTKKILFIFPFLKRDFFLHWNEENFKGYIKKTIDVFIQNDMLILKAKTLVRADEGSEAYNQLYIQSQIALSTMQRYAIVLSALTSMQENKTRSELRKYCQRLTQRVAELQKLNKPEHFDQNLFQNMFNILVEKRLVTINDNNTFEITPEIYQLQETILEQLNIQSKYLLLQSTNSIK